MVSRRYNLDARPYNLGFMRGTLAIKGSVDAANAKLDPAVNKIVPVLIAAGTLKSSAEGLEAVNVTPSVGAILYSVQQAGQDKPNIIVGAGGVEHPCTSPVTDKIPTRLTFTAPAGLEAGTYTLALTGKGRGETPVMLTKPNVTVKAGENVPTVERIVSEGKDGFVEG